MEEEKKNDTWWDKNGLTSLFAALFGIFSWWVLHPFINSALVMMSGVSNSPENQGMLGDSYGSLNSLFSGIAMIAAVTAVLIQTFEFKAQREELALSRKQLRLQLDEMEQQRKEMTAQRAEMERTNTMNHERMLFDKANHEYQRRLQSNEQMRRFATQEYQDYFHRLLSLKSTSAVSLSEFIECVFDDSKYASRSRHWSNADRTEMGRVSQAMQSAPPLLHLLQEIAFTNPNNEEMKIWAVSLEAIKPVFGQIKIAATNTTQWERRPTWLPGIVDLASRDYSQFL